MNVRKIQNLIDTHMINLYIEREGTSCIDRIMTKIEKEKERIIQAHINNVYPIKEIRKGDTITGYYTKMTPSDRNHSGKITAKTIEELKLKILAKHYELTLFDYTCRDILNFVVADYYANGQSATGDTHRQNFNRCFLQLADVKINQLSYNIIESALDKLVKSGIKAKAFNKAISTLNKMNDYCEWNNISCIDIRQSVKKYRAKRLSGRHNFVQDNRESRNLAFTEAEAVAIIKYALANPSYKALFSALVITTGCRAGELLCMAYDNITPDHNWFIVREIEDSKTRQIKPYTKTHELREIYLNADARRLLDVLLELRSQDADPSRFLFLNDNADDNKLHLRAADDWIRDIQPILGFDRTKEVRSLHDGRRTYASIQYLHGVSIDVIRRQLGHRTISQTEEYIKEIIDQKAKSDELEKGCLTLETA